MKKNFFIIFILTSIINSSLAQKDSLSVSFQSFYNFSSNGYSPHWISANRYGILDENRNDGLTRLAVSHASKYKEVYYGLGFDLIGKPYKTGSYIHQGYFYLKYKPFQFTVGKIEETHGTSYPSLTTGSMGISSNARPLSKLEIAVKEFANVPFLNGLIQYKGSLSHRWFEEDRYISTPYLHEKSFYLRTGKIPFISFYGGFVHYTIWSGEHPTLGKLPSRFKDFQLIFLGKDADSDYEGSQGLGGEKYNALGDHQGFYDFGIEMNVNDVSVKAYHQTFFEDRSGWMLFYNPDRLAGLAVEFKKAKLINAVLYEYVNTFHQSGHGWPDSLPGIDSYGHKFGGRDDYYNNYLYRSGWTYHRRVMGNSLFTTHERAMNYFGGIDNYNVSIVNNRIRAHHLGVSGSFYKDSSYKLLATYTENYGTHAGLYNGRYQWDYKGEDYLFYHGMKQWYLMFEFNSKLHFNKNIEVQTAFGADVGDMTNNFGVLLGLKWNGILYLK